MMRIILEAWDNKKDTLLKTIYNLNDFNSICYKDLVKLAFDEVYNAYLNDTHQKSLRVDTQKIHEIDDGDYQGTYLYIIPRDIYQPLCSEYLMTTVEYGSCSGCDALQAIVSRYNLYMKGQTISEECAKEILTLCRDILCNTVRPFNKGVYYDSMYDNVEY